MTSELMEEQVRQLIERVYCRKYVGYLKATELKDCQGYHFGWKVSLGLYSDEKPLEIAFDGTDDEFLTLLEKRLRQDHLHTTDYYNGYKITMDPNFEGQLRKDNMIKGEPYYRASII